MSPLKYFLLYSIVGSVVLAGALSIFGVRFKIWQAILACVLAGIAYAFLPRVASGFVGFACVMLTLRFTTNEGWKELSYPALTMTFVLALVVFMMDPRWKAVAAQ